jgi:hypothetical protein
MFEETHTCKDIKRVVHESKCPKIDHAHIDTINKKADLIEYLHNKDCPELKKMEAEIMENKIV